MSSQLIKNALLDVIPTFEGPFPPQLVSYTDTLYNTTSQKLGNLKSLEFARLHVCAYLAVELLRAKLDLPEPRTNKVPVPPRKLQPLLQDFRAAIFSKSAPVSPAKRSAPSTPLKFPKRPHGSSSTADGTVSPLLQRLLEEGNQDDVITPLKRGPGRPRLSQTPLLSVSKRSEMSPFNDESPFRDVDSPVQSPRRGPGRPRRDSAVDSLEADASPRRGPGRPRKQSSPVKDGEPVKRGPGRPRKDNSPLVLPSKGALPLTPKRGPGRPKKSESPFYAEIGTSPLKKPQTPNKLAGDFAQILSPLKRINEKVRSDEVIALCNKFKLPQEAALGILASFRKYGNRIKNEWAILCGLIAIAYFRIFKTYIAANVGARNRFLERLHQYQRGGLIKPQMVQWIKFTEELCACEKWVRNLELKYNYRLDYDVIKGSMILPAMRYSGAAISSEYEEWKHKLMNDLDLIE
ncbi:hypothetical protein BABINDRAFT_159182 [Babjeviella inositovora NRRL Y-12698]|uniref:ORC6 first cyclin-like domain-containing protein n=1 Tax=Babjeviella inositovora NRRL Y-12698 TaxID=984486 RepID=A0A1E3QYE8_9ASCO|nr:uncharacterized protein BABINDRAFT_159182 [Babjeviella inositovora NRRL Y-12698]ODQ82636.1 hypothetical protein BABINDRAFT_159182 [Babjeviella inositovora NRRL Y-12698]